MANYVSQFTGKEIDDAIANHVPKTRTINNKELSDNINLTAADVGAMRTGGGGDNGDFNTMIFPGCYRFDSNWTNGPANAHNWGQLLVIRSAADTLAQIVFRYDTNQAWMRTASKVYDDNIPNIDWQEWVPIFTPNEPIILNSANYGAGDPPADKPIGFIYFKKVT
jgi:hypothetical protein